MNKSYAYVTIATSKNYLLGVMTMYISLQQTGTSIPLYVMIPSALATHEPLSMERLKSVGMHIIEYDHSISIHSLVIEKNLRQGFDRFNSTFDKLLVFDLIQFDKIVYIDADMFVLYNLDHLFDYPHMSAVVAGHSFPGNENWVDLNSGLMVIQPQEGLAFELQKYIPKIIECRDVCGDQDVLQLYYYDWPNHPEKNLGEKYNVFSQHASFYENNLGYSYSNEMNNPKSIAVIHFIGEQKPWMQHWSFGSVLKQELQLLVRRLVHKRDTKTVLLEYKHLVRKAKKLL